MMRICGPRGNFTDVRREDSALAGAGVGQAAMHRALASQRLRMCKESGAEAARVTSIELVRRQKVSPATVRFDSVATQQFTWPQRASWLGSHIYVVPRQRARVLGTRELVTRTKSSALT